MKANLYLLFSAVLFLGFFSSTTTSAASQIYLPFTNTDALFTLNTGSTNRPFATQSSLVVGSDGVTLFGTSIQGGSNSVGAIYSVRSDDSALSFLHAFSTNLLDGSMGYMKVQLNLPVAAQILLEREGNIGGILAVNGWLYGTTPVGGTNNDGIIYRMGQDGSGFQVLYNFGAADSYPVAPPILAADGCLYGTCCSSTIPGTSVKGGAIYKINADGSDYSILGYTTNAENFSALLQASDGNLYGNAVSASGFATFFCLNTNGTDIAFLYTNTAVGAPLGTLIQTYNGLLIGTAYNGGTSNYGTIFSISTNGQNFQVLHNFNSGTIANDGMYPQSGLTFAGGYFYGTTFLGGDGFNTSAESGTVYRLAPDGTGYAQIYSFYTNPYGQYGQFSPSAGLTSGLFQGTTGAIFGTYHSSLTGGPGGVYGLLINPPATITPATGQSGGQLTVTWPSWAASYNLQSTTNLISGVWTNVTNGTPVIGIQLPSTKTNNDTFYRLVSP